MSKRLVLSLATALSLLAGSGCDEKKPTKKADDELTIVFEADKAKIDAQSRALESERERLRAEIDKLESANKGGTDKEAGDGEARELLLKLIHQQEEVAKKRDALSKETDQLLQKVIGEQGTKALVAPAPLEHAGPNPVATAAVAEVAKVTSQVVGREKEIAGREKTLAEREGSLAEREKSLAQREAALATRDSACVSAANAATAAAKVEHKPAPPTPGLDKGAVEKAYKALLGLMDSKGVLASDLPAGKQAALKLAAGFQKGDLAQALDAIEQVEAAVNATAIDGPFVSEKAKRVDALQRSSKNAKARDDVRNLLQDMARAYSDGRYAEANRALNNIVHVLEKQP